MAKDKPQPQAGPELAEYTTAAQPKAYADGVPVFCAHDAIVPLKDLRTKPKFDNHKGYANVIECSRTGNELHPTQKPTEIIEILLDNTQWANGVVDFFGGSGTTLAACEAYGQPSYTMELTPAFTDVIVKRYIRITGKQNVRCVRQGRELSREEISGIFGPDEEGGGQE